MARFGQTYGINGNAAFATVAYENRAVSDDLLRITPREDTKFRSGYLIVRLNSSIETVIADLAEASAAHRAQADVLERELAAEAGSLLDRFWAGDTSSFVVTVPAVVSHFRSDSPVFAEHGMVRLRAAIPAESMAAGQIGSVVHVYADGLAYEVEFMRPDGRWAVLTLDADQLEAAEPK